MSNLAIVNWSDYFMIDVCDLNGKLRFSYLLNNTGTKRIILKVSDKELEDLACDYFFNQNGYDTADYSDFEFVD